jgi:hypothetical protein
MTQRPDPSAPPPPPGSEESVPGEETSHRGSVDAGVDGGEVDEERYEPTDPHPDTPDDFDEDASAPRQSEEAIPESTPDDDD